MNLGVWMVACSTSLALASVVAGCSGSATTLGGGSDAGGRAPAAGQTIGGVCANGQSIQSCTTKDGSGNCSSAYYTLGAATFNCASCADVTGCATAASEACASASGSGSGGGSGSGSGGGSG